MTRILMCCLFAAGLLTSCASTEKNELRAQYLLRSGTAHLAKGNYPQALRDLLAAERFDSKNPIVQNNLGLAYFVREKYELAEAHIRRAVELDPKYTEARNNLGRVLVELSRFDEAVGQIEKVLADLTYTEPDKAWFNIGLAYFRRGNFNVAKDKFAETVRLNRQHCLGNTYYGRTLLELGDFDRAASTLDNAVGMCKNAQHDEPHYYSGISYYKLGRTDKAVARMEEVIRLYPQGKFSKRAESMLQIMLK